MVQKRGLAGNTIVKNGLDGVKISEGASGNVVNANSIGTVGGRPRLQNGDNGVHIAYTNEYPVTALFRRPLGLPIPHTGLIPANWELLASRVGTMVGDRVLTREYLVREIDRLDLAEWLARTAERVSRADLEAEFASS